MVFIVHSNLRDCFNNRRRDFSSHQDAVKQIQDLEGNSPPVITPIQREKSAAKTFSPTRGGKKHLGPLKPRFSVSRVIIFAAFRDAQDFLEHKLDSGRDIELTTCA